MVECGVVVEGLLELGCCVELSVVVGTAVVDSLQ